MEYLLGIAIIWFLYIAIVVLFMFIVGIFILMILAVIDTIFSTKLSFKKWNFKYHRIG